MLSSLPLTTLLLLSHSPTPTTAKDFTLEWFKPASDADLFPDETAEVGDTVYFEWTQQTDHNVLIHPSGTCEKTGAVLIGRNFEDTWYRFREKDAGKEVVFACDVMDHCGEGQIVKFTVAAKENIEGEGPFSMSDDQKVGSGDEMGGEQVDEMVSNGAVKATSTGDGSAGVAHFGDGVRRLAIASITMIVSLSYVALC